MAATIKDIAQKTGLGLATISSYLNGGNVREKNRVKIEEAIRELHFEINETARGLKTNTTSHHIGARHQPFFQSPDAVHIQRCRDQKIGKIQSQHRYHL